MAHDVARKTAAQNQQRRTKKANILSWANSKENMASAQEERQQLNTFDLFGEDLYLCFYCSVESPFDNYPPVRVSGSQPLMFQHCCEYKGKSGIGQMPRDGKKR